MTKFHTKSVLSIWRGLVIPALLVLLTMQVSASDPERGFTIAHSLDYRPLCYIDSAGESRGILIDYWRLWSRKTGTQIRFVPAAWDECLERVQSGEVDILAGAFYSPERDRDFDFSATLIEIKTVLFVRTSLSVERIGDLLDKTVAVTRGDRAGEFLRKYYPNLNVREFDSFEGPVRAAAAGEVDALAMDAPSAAYFFDRYNIDGEFQPFRTLYVGRMCATVAEGRLDLLAIVDDGISQINDEELTGIIDRWAPPSGAGEWLLLKWLLGSLVAIVLIMGLTQMITLRIRLRRHKLELAAAQATLTKADQQLCAIVDVSPVPLIVTQFESGRILYVNNNLAKMMDYTKEELLGNLSPDFYYDVNDRNRLLKILLRDGRVDNYEVRLKKKGGQPLWAIFSLAITEIGGEKMIMGGLYDITVRKQMEEALKSERNFVSAVLDTAGALVLVLDPEGRVIRFNAECVRVSGYTFEELKGRIIWDIVIPPDEVGMLEELFAYILESHKVVEGENHWRSKDGCQRLFSWSNAVLRDDQDNAEYVVAIGIDITERRIAEEQLRLYREIYLNSKDGIVVIDNQGCFVESNPTHKMFSGKTAEELEGCSFDSVLPIDCAQECHQQILKTGSYRVQNTSTSTDGQERTVDISLYSIKDESNLDSYYVGVGRDISEMKKLVDDLEKTNRELRDTQTQLIQSEKMASLGMLVAGVAHEINTPLGAINSMHDTLVRSVEKLKNLVQNVKLPDDDAKLNLEKYLTTIDDANRVIASGSERVTNIVRRLRSFARLDEAELQNADIHEGIEDTLTLIHHEIKHNVTIVKNYGDLPRINCYPGQLNQVFLNILINAKQSITDQGEITITTSVLNGRIQIAFADNGQGIPADRLSKIFDPGFTTKGVGVGTGLGLSICYQIIQDHHGEIKVDSEVGVGTTFTILLPIK